jgi:predicted aspartyl protease
VTLSGVVRDGMPWVPITLDSRKDIGSGMLWGVISDPIEFILDTAFQGSFALPQREISRLSSAEFSHNSIRRMADGSLSEVAIYSLSFVWNDESRTVEIVTLEGDPLIGIELLQNCFLSIDLHEGGEVQIDLPD